MTFGDSVEDRAWAMAGDADGNLYVAGGFAGTLQMGTALLESAGLRDAFVAKLDAEGTVSWAVRFGDAADQELLAIAFANNTIYVGGSYRGAPQVGSVQLPNATSSSGGWVAALDPTSGVPTMVAGFPPGPTVGTRGVTTIGSAGGSLYVGLNGSFGLSQQNPGAELRRLDEVDGATMDSVTWWNARDLELTVADNGDVLVVGAFSGIASFGGDTFTASGADDKITDGFLVRVEPSLAHVWSKQIGGDMNDRLSAVVERSDGTIVAAGHASTSFSFGGTNVPNAGASDLIVLEFASGGTALGALSIGSKGTDIGEALGVDAAGNVIVAGTFGDNIQIDGKVHAHHDLQDMLVVKLDRELMPMWSFAAASSGEQRPTSVAIDGADRVSVGGNFTNAIELASPHTSAGNTDVFVVQLNP